MVSSDTELAIFRLVAYCLRQLRYRVPSSGNYWKYCTVFLDKMPCSPAEVKRRFEGIYSLLTEEEPSKSQQKPEDGSITFLRKLVNLYMTARCYVPQDSGLII
jgi:hypothetical protein